jgi:hypothetical protein
MELITLKILLGESCYDWHPYAYGFICLAQGPPTFAQARSVMAESASSLAIKGALPGGQIPFSFSFSIEKQSHRRPISPTASHRSSQPSSNSFGLDHCQDSPMLLPQFSQLKLASSGLHSGSWCHLSPLGCELLRVSIGYLMSATSSCS